MGFVAPTNSGSSGGGSTPTQVTLTASDVFAKNDPVFVDWKTGEVINMANSLNMGVLTAGPALTAFPMEPVTNAGATYATNARAADGSVYIFSATVGGYTANTLSKFLVVNKYSDQGVLLGKVVVQPLPSSSTVGGSFLTCAVLSNGNVAVTYATGADTAPAVKAWAILSPTLQILYSGTSTSYPNFHAYHLQPTANGGFLSCHQSGIDFVSATGVLTELVNIPASGNGVMVFGAQDELNDNGIKSDSGACPDAKNRKPIAISGGGFGYVYANGTSAYYAQVNADGTLRGSVSLIYSFPNGTGPTDIRVAVSTNGNIMWTIYGDGGTTGFGIVSDSGVIIKAGATITNFSRVSLKLLADANGNFTLFTYSGTAWYLRYMSQTGLDLFGSPILLMTTASNVAKVAKLSSGTVLAFGVTNTVFVMFVTLAGVVKTRSIPLNTSQSGPGLGLVVTNDNVYGVCGAGAGGSADLAAFSVNTAGQLLVSAPLMGVALTPAAMRVLLNSAGTHLLAIVPDAATGNLVVTYELATLRLVQSYSVTYNIIPTHILGVGKGLLCSAYAASTAAHSVLIKPNSTVLVGVAAEGADKGDPLPVNTQGVFALSPKWARVAETFNHSTNSPPGNAGALSNGLISLKGF